MKHFLSFCFIVFLTFSLKVISKDFKDSINKNFSIHFVLPDDYSVRPDPLDDYNVTYWLTPGSEEKGAFSLMVQLANIPEDDKSLKENVIKTGDYMAKRSAEGKYRILELKNNDNKLIGYYLTTMTDPNAKEHQPNKIIVGQVLMNNALVIFTYQFSEEKNKNIEEVLDIVRKMEIRYEEHR